jgi:DNA-binding response OmpR family regulator
VESEEGRGTVVTVSFPLGNVHLKPDEIFEQVYIEKEISEQELEQSISETYGTEELKFGIDAESDPPSVLLVEDNSDVRYFIKGNLEKEYRICESEDGEDGWNNAVEHLPDVIISDVMMPKMDGFELCKKLKTDERTSHIPVILLTAKATMKDKIEGLETGADAYIMKPFEPDELKARIRNLIEQRKRLHEHFKKQGIAQFNDSPILSIDKKFLQKVFYIITENIPNQEFSVELLAEQSAVSRSVLHRKIVSLTGEPPVELIRRIRLTRAIELIRNHWGNLSEIALEVGFNNPAYFSECFKKQFGVSPSQYLGYKV